MKVHELIKKLQALPQDVDVMISHDEYESGFSIWYEPEDPEFMVVPHYPNTEENVVIIK